MKKIGNIFMAVVLAMVAFISGMIDVRAEDAVVDKVYFSNTNVTYIRESTDGVFFTTKYEMNAYPGDSPSSFFTASSKETDKYSVSYEKLVEYDENGVPTNRVIYSDSEHNSNLEEGQSLIDVFVENYSYQYTVYFVPTEGYKFTAGSMPFEFNEDFRYYQNDNTNGGSVSEHFVTFGVNLTLKSNVVELTPDDIRERFNTVFALIPDVVILDNMTQKEFFTKKESGRDRIVFDYVNNYLKDKGHDIESYDISGSAYRDPYSVSIYKVHLVDLYSGREKNVELSFKNDSDFVPDYQIEVNGIMNKNKDTFATLVQREFGKIEDETADFIKVSDERIEKLFNGYEVYLEPQMGYGSISQFGGLYRATYYIFRDDVLYARFGVARDVIPYITIPNGTENISDYISSVINNSTDDYSFESCEKLDNPITVNKENAYNVENDVYKVKLLYKATGVKFDIEVGVIDENSNVPEDKPSTPEDKPTTPEDKPTTPDDKPTTPDDKPTTPDDKPNTPSKPIESVDSPIKTVIVAEKELPAGSTLKVNEISVSEELYEENSALKVVYDISVYDENNQIVHVSDNKLLITIDLDEELLGYGKYEVLYIKDGAVLETIPAKVVDGKLSFETTHLSQYGIAAYNLEEVVPQTPNTGDNLIIYVMMLLASSVGIIICRKMIAKN